MPDLSFIYLIIISDFRKNDVKNYSQSYKCYFSQYVTDGREVIYNQTSIAYNEVITKQGLEREEM